MDTTIELLVKRGYELLAQEERQRQETEAAHLDILRKTLASALPVGVWQTLGIDPMKLMATGPDYGLSGMERSLDLYAWLTIHTAVIQIGNAPGEVVTVGLTVNNLDKQAENLDKLCRALAEYDQMQRNTAADGQY
jgi:hypothetical protein